MNSQEKLEQRANRIFLTSLIMPVVLMILVIAGSIALTSCGTDESGNSGSTVAVVAADETEHTEAVAIASDSDLPDCDEENEDQLILTRDDKLFHVCEDGAWTSISFGGNGIVEQYTCGGSNDLDPGTNSVYGTYLNATKFENGDWHLSCGASHSLFFDDASYDVWFSAASQGVYNGEITCIPPYVYAKFNIENGTVTYTKSTDVNLNETIKCTKVN